jgi:uncharacterized protein
VKASPRWLQVGPAAGALPRASRISGSFPLLLFLAALLAVFLSCRLLRVSFRTSASAKPPLHSANAPSAGWSDSYGDGTPDFLRLTDPADQAAFRRWFTLIAQYQAVRPKTEVPAEITDCASLLRYSYREALKRHNEAWITDAGIEVSAPPGEIRAWSYPHSPLGTALFRVRPGEFQPSDIGNGAFAQFADARTLVERNTFFVSRDVREVLPGDLLFYRQFGQSSPWHSMIVTRAGVDAELVYDTGPDHLHQALEYRRSVPPPRSAPEGRGASSSPGELRRVAMAELLDHPQPQWRPLPANPNFLGVYRWNILRGAQ